MKIFCWQCPKWTLYIFKFGCTELSHCMVHSKNPVCIEWVSFLDLRCNPVIIAYNMGRRKHFSFFNLDRKIVMYLQWDKNSHAMSPEYIKKNEAMHLIFPPSLSSSYLEPLFAVMRIFHSFQVKKFFGVKLSPLRISNLLTGQFLLSQNLLLFSCSRLEDYVPGKGRRTSGP